MIQAYKDSMECYLAMLGDYGFHIVDKDTPSVAKTEYHRIHVLKAGKVNTTAATEKGSNLAGMDVTGDMVITGHFTAVSVPDGNACVLLAYIRPS